MSVTCETFHLPIGPCRLVGWLLSEDISSRQQSSTARLSSSRDCGENTDNGVSNAFLLCCRVFALWCDFGVGADIDGVLKIFNIGEPVTSKQASAVTLHKILNIKKSSNNHHHTRVPMKKEEKHNTQVKESHVQRELPNTDLLDLRLYIDYCCYRDEAHLEQPPT